MQLHFSTPVARFLWAGFAADTVHHAHTPGRQIQIFCRILALKTLFYVWSIRSPKWDPTTEQMPIFIGLGLFRVS